MRSCRMTEVIIRLTCMALHICSTPTMPEDQATVHRQLKAPCAHACVQACMRAGSAP